MRVRFGFVAMSTLLPASSPSRTMTYANFVKLPDREAGLRKLEHIAAGNLDTTLRLLKHCRYMDVRLYRLTSKLVPLATHDAMRDWNPFEPLRDKFAEIGDFAREHGIRLSFHPDHFTVLSTPREEVYRHSVLDLNHHATMLELMGLDERATCNIHVGGTYGDKPSAARRFVDQFRQIEPRIANRITLENDDKTFTALETLQLSEEVGAPMVFDLHHHQVNSGNETPVELWPRIARTWETFGWNGRRALSDEPLPPKMHISSPKSASDPRSHADDVDPAPLLRFLLDIADRTPAIDVMIEAKQKDGALQKLMEDMQAFEAAGEAVRVIDGASVDIG